jgi:hypothetical protein
MGTVRKVVRRYGTLTAASLPGARALYKWKQDYVAPRLRASLQDARNRGLYGAGAPRYAERLWIDPLAVRLYAPALHGSGTVMHGEWSMKGHADIDNDPVLRDAIAHWTHGVPWEETEEVNRMQALIARKGPVKGCRSRADILARCAGLDALFAQIASEGRVRPRSEVERRAFREHGGIGMHIGPDGMLIRAQNGRHRFAIARVLGLPGIPVRIGRVHLSALAYVEQLRRGEEDTW